MASTLDDYNDYICVNTEDKVFLLSHKEVTNTSYGLNSNSARKKRGADYAKCQGLFIYSGVSSWWLRSPFRNRGGASDGVDETGWHQAARTNYIAQNGVVPAMWIDLGE